MSSWQEMKKGQVYECGECGLKLQVIQECTACDSAWTCDCPCSLSHCQEEPTLKQVGKRGAAALSTDLI
jgi:hypothetical protein